MNDEERNMLIEIHGGMKTLTAFCKKHEKALYGNGRPGLISRMTRAETILWIICGVAGVGIPAMLAS